MPEILVSIGGLNSYFQSRSEGSEGRQHQSSSVQLKSQLPVDEF